MRFLHGKDPITKQANNRNPLESSGAEVACQSGPCWAEMAGALSPITTSQWIWDPQEESVLGQVSSLPLRQEAAEDWLSLKGL